MGTRPVPGRSILVVEDDNDIREALSQVLQDEGYQVGEAANGQEALDRLHNGCHPDLIVLDLMMPVMDGWQFRREQQRDPELAGIPVVVVSADGSVRQKAASIGATSYVKKPIDFATLLDVVGQHAASKVP